MIVIWVLIGLAMLCLLASLAAYLLAFYAPTRRRERKPVPLPGAQYERCKEELLRLTDALTASPCQRVTITAYDGTRLCARYYHVRDGAPLEILFHGYRSYALRDCAGGFRLCMDNGYNVLLPDHRAHGDSGGHTITFGVKEREDCRSWARWAEERFGAETKILLCGVSMGAATVLMASELSLPEGVRCVMADCGYTSPREIIEKVMRGLHLPVRLIWPFLRLGAWLFGGFDPQACSAEAAVRHTTLPVLIIHGEEDGFVPWEMGQRLYEACAGEKRFLSVPGAGHGLSYFGDTAAYTHTVEEFSRHTLENRDGDRRTRRSPDVE